MSDKQIIWERYLEIIQESRVDRYLNMYNKLFFVLPESRSLDSEYNPANCKVKLIEDRFCLREVIQKLRRDDIIQWYIRKTLFATFTAIVTNVLVHMNFKAHRSNIDIEKNEDFKKILKNYNLIEKDLKDREYKNIIDTKNNQTLLQELEHYLALNIDQINDFRFTNQSIEAVLQNFKNLEREWQHNSAETIDITDDLKSKRVKTLLEVSKNTEWQIINSSFCNKEGEVMGHCGNNVLGGIDEHNVKLLSYRTITHKGNKVIVKPHLTFIYHLNDKSLTERKGAQNTKPVEKYHDAILKLLMLKDNNDFFIKKIKSDGYLPQNNFEISDLSESNKKILYSKRPDLFDSGNSD